MAQVPTQQVVVAAVPMDLSGGNRTIPTNPAMEVLKPANIQQLGGAFERENPTTIGGSRGRQPGLNTRFGANGNFDGPMSRSFLEFFLPGLTLNKGQRREFFNLSVTSISATNDELTVAAIPRAIQAGELIEITGSNAGNDGVYTCEAAAVNATTIGVTESLQDEAAGNANLRYRLVGYRVPSGTTGAWTYNSTTKEATLAISGIGTVFTNARFEPGSGVSIGSNTGTNGADNNAMRNTADNDTAGYAVIKSIDTDAIVFNGLATELARTIASTSGGALDIMQDYSHRDVSETGRPADFEDVGYLIEEAWPRGADNGTDTIYRYLVDARISQAVLTIPLTGAITLAYTGPGTRARQNVEASARLSAGGTYNEPVFPNFFSSRGGVARLRIKDLDEFGLATSFSQLSLTINNNRNPIESIGVIGADDISVGELQVDVSATTRFQTGRILDRILNQTPTKLDLFMQNEDGMIMVTLASTGLGDGAIQYTANENLQMSVTAQSHEDNEYSNSFNISVISRGVDRRPTLD